MAKLLILPPIHPLMTRATITRLLATPGTVLPVGTPLLDLGVDLAEALAHDCPPVSHYRLILREPARLDAWHAVAGDALAAPAVLATFDGAGHDRPIRVMVTGIVPDHGWWATET